MFPVGRCADLFHKTRDLEEELSSFLIIKVLGRSA